MSIYQLPMLLVFIVIYIMSIMKYLSIRRSSTFKVKYKLLALIGLLGGSLFLYFRLVFPYFTQFLTLDVIIEFFVFIHLLITVSYLFVGIKLED